MLVHLSNYLQQHKSLSIPGLGTIYVEVTPAQSDFTNKQILPPGYHYRFDRYFDAPGKDLFSFLANIDGVPDYVAIKNYSEWATDLRNRIKENQEVKLKGIGTIRKDKNGEFEFESAGAISTYLAPINAERIIHTNTSHTMLVGDKETTNVEMTGFLQGLTDEARKRNPWLIIALIIGILSIAIIVIHFIRNGLNAGSLGNKNKIEIQR